VCQWLSSWPSKFDANHHQEWYNNNNNNNKVQQQIAMNIMQQVIPKQCQAQMLVHRHVQCHQHRQIQATLHHHHRRRTITTIQTPTPNEDEELLYEVAVLQEQEEAWANEEAVE
jgi:hypothetical protein